MRSSTLMRASLLAAGQLLSFSQGRPVPSELVSQSHALLQKHTLVDGASDALVVRSKPALDGAPSDTELHRRGLSGSQNVPPGLWYGDIIQDIAMAADEEAARARAEAAEAQARREALAAYARRRVELVHQERERNRTPALPLTTMEISHRAGAPHGEVWQHAVDSYHRRQARTMQEQNYTQARRAARSPPSGGASSSANRGSQT